MRTNLCARTELIHPGNSFNIINLASFSTKFTVLRTKFSSATIHRKLGFADFRKVLVSNGRLSTGMVLLLKKNIYFKVLMRKGSAKTAASKRLRETTKSGLLQTGGHSPFARDGAPTKKLMVWEKDGGFMAI
jgi:hypothetical protein